MDLNNTIKLIEAQKAPFDFLIKRTQARLSKALSTYEKGSYNVLQFSAATKKILKRAYAASYKKGGGLQSMSPEGKAWIQGFADQQFKFLDGFASDIEAGVGTMNYETRIQMYADAIRAAYWAGATVEAEEGTEMDWVLGDAEHCEDCEELSAASPYTPDTLPTVPGAGDTRCLGRCKCSLVSVRK